MKYTLFMNMVFIMVSAMTAMAFYTLSERKFLGYMQMRKGPNKPTIMALTIPMADAMKLFTKNQIPMLMSNKNHYLLAPMLMISISLMLWPVFPMFHSSFFMKIGILYFLSISSMNVYTTFMMGWGSDSKWSMLGALRGIAQTISYEVSMSLILICLMIHTSKMNLSCIVRDQMSWMLFMMIPMLLNWTISILAETHRTPFDFTEGESELISGFNIEYSSSVFAMIFMAEYMNIVLMSLLTVSIFTKNMYSSETILKTAIFSFIFIWARGSLPRMRYDMLMNTLWKKILPLSLMLLLFIMPTSLM